MTHKNTSNTVALDPHREAIKNLRPQQRAQLLFDFDCTMASGDHLLLGTDLVKDVDRMVAAYDAAGITAQFNRTCCGCSGRPVWPDASRITPPPSTRSTRSTSTGPAAAADVATGETGTSKQGMPPFLPDQTEEFAPSDRFPPDILK